MDEVKRSRSTSTPTAGVAKECLQLFRILSHQAASSRLQETAALEDHRARFTAWTTCFSVFGQDPTSLDHRLRHTPELLTTIMGMLEVISDRLQRCKEALEDNSPVATFHECLNDLSYELNLLNKLSNTIIRATSTLDSHNLGAIEFNIRDKDGNNLGPALLRQFQHENNDRFPIINNSLLQRLGHTMLRRIRISQSARHEQLRGSDPTATLKRLLAEISGVEEAAASRGGRDGGVNSLELRDFVSASTCPRCLTPRSNREELDDNEWARHIEESLQAYVCLNEDCDNPNQLYKTVAEWIAHSQKHVQEQWRCTEHTANKIFTTGDDFIYHVRQHHTTALSEVRARVLARKSTFLPRPFTSCPLCGIRETEDNKSIVEHIAGHLRFLAIQSVLETPNEARYDTPTENASEMASHQGRTPSIDEDSPTLRRTHSMTTMTSLDSVFDTTEPRLLNWVLRLPRQPGATEDTFSLAPSAQIVLNRLRSARIESATDPGRRLFLPCSELLSILTPSVVNRILQESFSMPMSALRDMTSRIYVDGRPSALKIMGILMLIERLDLLPLFTRNKICDKSLPFQLRSLNSGEVQPDAQRTLLSDRNKMPLHGLDTAKWTHTEAESFVFKQMELYLPVFWIAEDDEAPSHYILSGDVILPFLDFKGAAKIRQQFGASGTVTKVRIEPSHLGCPEGTQKPKYVAIKRLDSHYSPGHPAKEVDTVVRRVVRRELAKKHVSRLLFTFLHGDSYFVAFEWADANLAEFWTKKPWRFRPSNLHDSLWFFEQCHGLAAGLHGIQRFRSSFRIRSGEKEIRYVLQDSEYMHNNIKPETILLYEDAKQDNNISTYKTPRLALAHMDRVEIHTAHTESLSLSRISSPQGVISAYGAPEIETVRMVGPKYDVWALGCVFLEHASVFIEQNGEVVEKFSILRNKEDWDTHHSHEHRYTGNTFYIIRGFEDGEKAETFCKAVTKATVTQWITRLKRHENCSPAMRDFLELIQDRMLVVDTKERFQAQEVHVALARIRLQCEKQREPYACTSSSLYQGTTAAFGADKELRGMSPDSVEVPDTTLRIPELHRESSSSSDRVPELTLSTDVDVSAPLGYEEALEQIAAWERISKEGNGGA